MATLPRDALQQGVRLVGQQTRRAPLEIDVDQENLAKHRWLGTVLSNRTLSPMIRELRIAVPQEGLALEPGGFVQVVVAPPSLRLASLQIEAEAADLLGSRSARK